jgi:DNA glycosylase AlkZ-like
MPRAALLSIHARVARTEPSTWEDPSLVQLWGPRHSAYVVAARDLAVFSLGRLPDDAKSLGVAEDLAARLATLLGGTRMKYGEAGRALGEQPNRLRYAAPTGTVVIRWDGARQPNVWTVPAPEVDPRTARSELARRYLHIFGPTTPRAFTEWAGIAPRQGLAAFDALGSSLTPVRSPIGDGWILTRDEPTFRGTGGTPAPARLLPSGDAYFLLQGGDRELLVPDADHRSKLWTARVWPGALLVEGEIVGTWRRAHEIVTIQTWRRLSRVARDAVEAEAGSLPLPGVKRSIGVRWDESGEG